MTDDPRCSLADALTAPLADHVDLRAIARSEILERLSHARPAAGDDTPEEMLTRLDAVASTPTWRIVVKRVSMAVVILVTLCYIIATHHETRRMSHECPVPLPARARDPVPGLDGHGFQGQDRDFMFRNLRGSLAPDIDAPFPTTPVVFHEHLAALRLANSRTPPHGAIFSHGQTIDPGNALWILLELESSRELRNWLGPGGTRSTIDQAGVRELVAGLLDASRSGGYRDWIGEETTRRMAMLKEVRTLADQIERRQYFHAQNSSYSIWPLHHRLWEAEASRLWQMGEREQLEQWLQAWLQVLRWTILESPITALESRLLEIHQAGVKLARIARIADLQPLARKLDLAHQAASAAREKLRPVSNLAHPLSPEQILLNEVMPHTQVAVTVEEIEPLRQAHLAVMERIMATLAAAAFCIMAGIAALEGWRRPAIPCVLAHRTVMLFRSRDHATLLVIAGGVPIAWHLSVLRLSPWSIRDALWPSGEWQVLAIQTAASVTFATCLAVQSARWMMARRCGALALRPHRFWPGWCASLWAAAAVPAVAFTRAGTLPPGVTDVEIGLRAALLVAPLWLCWISAAYILRPARASLDSALAGRVLAPVMAGVAALWILLIALPLAVEERREIARDPVGTLDHHGKHPHQARFERDLRETLGRILD